MDKDRVIAKMPTIIVKTFLILLCFGLIVTVFGGFGAMSAHAAGTPSVRVGEKTVHRGQTFVIDVELSDNEGLIGLYLSLDYDADVMRLTNVERGDALESLTFTAINTQTDIGYAIRPFNMLWDGKESDSTNGTLVRLTFESFADAELGTYPITMTYDPNNTNSEYDTPIAVSITNGSVTLIKGEFEAFYYDWDDTLLYRKDYNTDDLPSYQGETPYREEDACYSYAFNGWKGIVSDDVHVLKYQADYILTPKVYQAFYYVDGVNEDSFDGSITAEDYYAAYEIAYGTFLDNEYPVKPRYVFSGWFLDDQCTTPFTETHMPAEDITLYGYFVYDIRTTLIPKIRLTAVEGDDDIVTVFAEMVSNTGFNGLVLTLDYDRSVLEFIGYEKEATFSTLQFDTTHTDSGYDVENFKFYYEHTENTYETGVFLKMNFRIKKGSSAGVYPVTFTLGNTDATYINGTSGARYTAVEIIGAQVAVGKIYQWDRSAEDNAEIRVTSDLGMPADTTLKVALVPESKHQIDQQKIEEIAGSDMEVKSVYNLRLLRILGNEETEVQPDGTLIVEIRLTPEVQACKRLALYYVSDAGEMTLVDIERDGDVLRFRTDHLSFWAIVGEKNVVSGKLTDAAVMLITMPILLAIATMGYVLIIMGKNKKKQKGEIDE